MGLGARSWLGFPRGAVLNPFSTIRDRVFACRRISRVLWLVGELSKAGESWEDRQHCRGEGRRAGQASRSHLDAGLSGTTLLDLVQGKEHLQSIRGLGKGWIGTVLPFGQPCGTEDR